MLPPVALVLALLLTFAFDVGRILPATETPPPSRLLDARPVLRIVTHAFLVSLTGVLTDVGPIGRLGTEPSLALLKPLVSTKSPHALAGSITLSLRTLTLRTWRD